MITAPNEVQMTINEVALLEHLERHCKGRANAIRREKLVEEFDTPDRHIRKMVETLIRDHHQPICTDRVGGGYFIPETDQELLEESDKLRKQALSILTRASVIRKFDLAKIQQELGFDDFT